MDEKGILKLNEEDVVSLSPILFKEFSRKVKPMVHILFGEHDSPSFKGQSLAFGKFVEKFRFAVSVKKFNKWDHFEIVEELSRAGSDITKYIFNYF